MMFQASKRLERVKFHVDLLTFSSKPNNSRTLRQAVPPGPKRTRNLLLSRLISEALLRVHEFLRYARKSLSTSSGEGRFMPSVWPALNSKAAFVLFARSSGSTNTCMASGGITGGLRCTVTIAEHVFAEHSYTWISSVVVEPSLSKSLYTASCLQTDLTRWCRGLAHVGQGSSFHAAV